jgi:phosphatidylinositol dimannoside acyltransferase
VNDSVVDAAYATGWRVVRGMPERLARAQFDALADAIWLRGRGSVERLQSNLHRVKPELNDHDLRMLTRAAMRSYMRYWREVFQLPKVSTAQIIGNVEVIGDDTLRAAVAAGKGLVLSLPHMGNWDVAGAWLTGTGVPFTTVAERLKPESLFNRFVEFRESLGMEVIPLSGGDSAPYRTLVRRLRAGGTLCLLGDRDLTASGIEVDFFGAPARMPAGPAALAHDTGATLLPVTLWFREGNYWTLWVHDEVPAPAEGARLEKIAAMTQSVASVFEASIAEHPEDWHMLQRVWVDDLERKPDRSEAGVADTGVAEAG